MRTSIIETPSFTESSHTISRPRIGSADHDIEEVAIGFGQSFSSNSTFGESHRMKSSRIGQATYRRVDPLHEPLKVADARLQKHLEDLCESLRAKY